MVKKQIKKKAKKQAKKQTSTKKKTSTPKKISTKKQTKISKKKVFHTDKIAQSKTKALTPEIVEPEVAIVPKIIDDSKSASNYMNNRKTVSQKYNLDLPESTPPSNSLIPTTSSDPVTRYMAEISRYPMLTREQEEDVAKHYYETKDPRLAEILVTSNLRFVVKVAAEYSKFGTRLIDLIQEGNVGLMQAVKEFNPYKGVKLITYAVWWIRGYIQEFLMRQYSLVRIGTTQNQRKLFYQLQKEKAELERLGEEIGIKQLSRHLGIPKKEVADMHKRLSGRDISLNQPLGPEEGIRLMDLQADESSANEMDKMIDLKKYLDLLSDGLDKLKPSLSKKENYILENRLLSDNPMTLQEIGEIWGVTREAVRQMEARLLGKLRKTILG